MPDKQPEPVITTKRLELSLIGLDETELMWEIDQDPEVMKYINGGQCTSREDVQNIFVPRLAQYRRPDKGWGLWKIKDIEQRLIYGWILVRPMKFFTEQPEYENIELGWRLKREAWGKGIATEAARGVLDYVASLGEVVKFSAIAMEENRASTRIMEKLGMLYKGRELHRDPLGDMPVVVYELNLNE